MPEDTLFELIEDVDDELGYFDGLIMYKNDFFDEKSGARHYLYRTLRERIGEKIITSNGDREKIIFGPLIHYLNALNKYYEYWDVIEKYKKRNAYHINKYGYEELNQILTHAMKELKNGKEFTDKIDRDSWFFDMNISEVSRQIDWIRSNYEGNLKSQLRDANSTLSD